LICNKTPEIEILPPQRMAGLSGGLTVKKQERSCHAPVSWVFLTT
jgi:hypothetical protein